MARYGFDPEQADSEFGARGASIVDAVLLDEQGAELKLVHGGELVELRITAELHAALDGLIFGFYLKDRLGQRLFGDNTFLATLEDAMSGEAGKRYSATFRFRMPTLPVGAYSVDAAVASGTQHDHTQQHWVHDALNLRAVDSSMRYGLVGIPMLDIAISEEG